MPRCIDPDLSYCLIDGRPLFLDLAADRYFRLSDALERAFLAHLQGTALPASDTRRLRGRGITPDMAPPGTQQASGAIEVPRKSAMEQVSRDTSFKVDATLGVFRDVCSVHLQLRYRTLKDTLASMATYRGERAKMHGTGLSAALQQRFCEASAAFLLPRLYVPVATRCLPDSIALVRFLARRGLFAHLVFGVMADPLSAHCWVQARHMVLNDTVGNACAHTPIRVV
ncbi:MAG: lasso peptide biosynthesis B2 protein [Stenotrophomonas sp.]